MATPAAACDNILARMNMNALPLIGFVPRTKSRRPIAVTTTLRTDGGTGTSHGERPAPARKAANMSASAIGSGSLTIKVWFSVSGLARHSVIACTRFSIATRERRLRKAANGSGRGNDAMRMIKAILAFAPGP